MTITMILDHLQGLPSCPHYSEMSGKTLQLNRQSHIAKAPKADSLA